MQTLGGNSAHKNLNYKEDGLPAVFASNNGFYASIIDLTNGDINDMANKNINMPFFKPNATAPISYSPLNTGFLYRIDSSSSPAFVLGKFDKLYADMNNLILQNFNKYRGYNLNQSSLIIARQDIGIDANGNIYNSGSLAGDNVNLSANSITNKDALILASNDINLNSSNSLNIISSALNAKDINLDSNEVLINQSGKTEKFTTHTQTTLGASSHINAFNDINLKANNALIKGSALSANADNELNILAAKEQIKEQSIYKKSSFNPLGILTYVGTLGTSGGEILKSSLNEKGLDDGTSRLSNITSKDTINLNTKDALITVTLKTLNDININANKVSILKCHKHPQLILHK